jgi:predicted ABC-type ATPase
MINEEIVKQSIVYFNKNKKIFFEQYSKGITSSGDKLAIFTAGMSGVGKTELSIFLKENNQNLLHIDTDEIREFFRPVGYDGQNSNLFQKVSSRGFDQLFSYALKNDFSLICDSNFASIDIEIQNVQRLLKKSYKVEIFYLYNEPTVCFEYATRREVVTHRKVPKDVFLRCNENSYRTVLAINDMFKDDVTLHFVDKRDNQIYNNIDSDFIKNIIGGNFEIR